MSGGGNDPRDGWVLHVLGIDVRSAGALDGAAPPAMAGWKAARGKAVETLRALAGAVDKMDYLDAPEAVILLRAIAANLTEEPSTPQQLAELRRYLETDDVIEEAEEPNGFGIEVSLRAPLLEALSALESAHKPVG
jgi:hypothetical protein